MFGLTVIDIVVIVAYFAVCLGIGFWSMRRIKGQEDYFLAGRRFGKLIQTFAAFGQATSSDAPVTVSTTTLTNGAAGIWSALNILFATPVYWMTSPWYRRMRLLTLGDFFEDRYHSKWMAGAYAIIQTFSLMVLLSVGYKAMSTTVMALSPKDVSELTAAERVEYSEAEELDRLKAADYNTLNDADRERLRQLHLENPRRVFSHLDATTLMVVVCVIVLISSVAGGLEAAFLTDLLQGSLIIILSLILLPFMFARINSDYGSAGVMGAFRIMHERLPESFFNIFGSPHAIDFTWYYIGAIMLMVTINVAVGANQLASMGSAKDEYSARFGFTSGLYLKRVCTVLWGLFALAGAVLYAGKVSDPDMMWGYATRDLVGGLGIGLVGLMIASMMAALMSTVSCIMITNAALLTRNVYRVWFPAKSEKHYVTIGRLSGAAVAIGGAWIALESDRLLTLLKLNWEFGVIFAASFWMGILWRKSNRKGAWVSILVTLIAFFILPILIPLLSPGLRTDAYMTKTTQPRTLERTYTAHQIDVETRNAEIAKWDQLKAVGQAQGTRPETIEVGKKFSKSYKLPPKGIFWTQGVKRDPTTGQTTGFGQLSPELVLLDKLGWDLSQNPYALNETIRVLIRVLTPFVILILFGYLARSDDPAKLDRFYVKMKTPARGDREVDERELTLSYANPNRFDHLKMFPRTGWEFCKWDRTDIVGFIFALLIAFAIIGLLFLVVTIGA